MGGFYGVRTVSALKFRLSTKAYHPFHSPFVVAFPIRFPGLFDDENSVLESRMPAFARLKVRIEEQGRKWKSVRLVNKGFFRDSGTAGGEVRKMKDTCKADGTEAASAEDN